MNTLWSCYVLRSRFAVAAFVVMGVVSLPAHAQCSRWTNELELPGFTPGADSATLSVVRALERFDDGTGPVLVAGGNFVAVDGVPAAGLAQWNGSTWTAMNPVVPTTGSPFYVSGLLAVGSDLYVGGKMPAGGSLPAVGYVSRVGATPAVLGTFTDNESATVRDFAIFGTLHAGGSFKNAGGTPANHIARYTGSGWAALGTGLNGYVNAMEVFDDGSGAQLYVAGNFLKAGGISTYGIARWNGTSWSTAGAAFGNWGWFDLELFDDGTGPGLYAAAWHEVSGELVMKYGGNHWSIIGVANGRIHAVATLDDGNGRALYVAGQFTSIDGISANSIAKWDGTQWSSLGGGLAVTVAPYGLQVGARALESLDDGSGAGPKIFAAGLFNRADADGVKHISAWEPCTFVGNTFCFGDGSLSTPCPCAPPNGSWGAGCVNSHHLTGAKLTALGTTNPDHVRLRGTTLNTYGFTVLLSGTGVITEGVAYGSGVRCVDGSFVRFGSQFAAWGAVAYPNAALGFDRPLSQVSGVTPGLGQTRFYQALYRDTGVNSCAPPWVNLSNAVEITW